MLVRLAIDYEHQSRRWWDNGGQELWDAVLESEGAKDVILDQALADSWLAQAGTIEGWSDGHEYAPHPVTTHTVDEEVDL